MRPLVLIPVVVLAGCSSVTDEGVGCDDAFRTLALSVSDASGADVLPTSASVTRVNGTSLVCPSTADRYRPDCVVPIDATADSAPRPFVFIAHDAMFETLSRRGERLRITASDGARFGTAEVVVRSGQCHVEQVSGPMQIVLR